MPLEAGGAQRPPTGGHGGGSSRGMAVVSGEFPQVAAAVSAARWGGHCRTPTAAAGDVDSEGRGESW